MDTGKVFENVGDQVPQPPKKQWNQPTFEVLNSLEIIKTGYPAPLGELSGTLYSS